MGGYRPLDPHLIFEGSLQTHRFLIVVAIWEAFYIESERFDLDTLRVPNRYPTPISKSDDFRGQSDDTWGARGPNFRPLGVPRVRAGNTYSMLCNSASGPEIRLPGQILAGLLPGKHPNRPSGRFPARKHYCVT